MTELEFVEGKLVLKLKELGTRLYTEFLDTVSAAKDFLNRFSSNFPTYTDHSIFHSFQIIKDIGMILEDDELDNLNADELYVLLCASVLHDIGMCIPQDKIMEFTNSSKYKKYKENHFMADIKDFMREIHHELSFEFIIREQEELKIHNEDYAKVIALIAKAHRKTNINNFDVYEVRKILRTGTDFVCMPFLACVLKIADELDITNMRTPDLIKKYYLPDDEKGKEEFEKHQKITVINRQGKILFIQGKCESKEIYNLLSYTVNNVDRIIAECQKIIHKVENVGNKNYKLTLSRAENEIEPIGFKPKNINFSYDNNLIFNYFISRNLYNEPTMAIREVLQNAIDACRLRTHLENDYDPQIIIHVEDNQVTFKDNGIGMDENDIENYFSRIGSSLFHSSNVVSSFESIGLFGVGILSFFLICNNFQIKTKKKHSNPLWFRIDKLPDLNYLFYEYEGDVEEGTQVIFPLTEENKKFFEPVNLHLYLEENLVNIEIPVNLEIQSSSGEYSFNPIFKTNFLEKDISELLIKLPFQLSGTGKIQHLTLDINEIDVEGQLNLFYILKESTTPNNLIDFHDLTKYAETVKVKLFYKGFFIQEVESKNLYCLGGYLNIKKVMELNINKIQFIVSNEVNAILQKYEIELLKQFLNKYPVTKDQKKLFPAIFRCRSFYSDSRISAYHDLFKQILVNECYDDEGFHHSTLQEILNNNSKFLLYAIFESIGDLSERESISLLYDDYNLPVYIPSYLNILLFLEWIYQNRFYLKVLKGPFFPILYVDTTKVNQDYTKLFNKYLVFEFDSEIKSCFASVFKSNSLFQCILNKDHPLIDFILNEKAPLAESIRILFIEFLELISRDSDLYLISKELEQKYSTLINEFNYLYKTSINPNLIGQES